MVDTENSSSAASPGFRDGFTRTDGLPVVPIVLGIVGHRKIREGQRDTLRAGVATILRQFRAAFPATPLVVLTGLAEGADQIAAEAAIEVEGTFVRAPLPFAAEVYKAGTSFGGDVAGEEGRQVLDRLLSNEARVEAFVVPLPKEQASELERAGPLRVATDEHDESLRALRHVCYANVGGYIARHCHLLIALWDGRDADFKRPSGTAEYVAMKLFGQPPAHYPWTDSYPLGFLGERGLVMVVHTPQDGSDDGTQAQTGAREAAEIRVLAPSDDLQHKSFSPVARPLAKYDSPATRFTRRVLRSFGLGESDSDDSQATENSKFGFEVRQFRETCTTIEDFNRDVARPEIALVVRDRLKRIGGSLRVAHLDDLYNRWLERIIQTREAAAAVANRLDRIQLQVQISIFVLLACCVGFFHVYSHLTKFDTEIQHPIHRPYYLVLFAIALIATFIVVGSSWWKRIDQRRIDSRTLAEALRIRLTWSRAGIGKSVADSYLRQLRSELSWIRRAVLHLCPPPLVWEEHFDRLDQTQQRTILMDVSKSWVEGQKKYFKGHWKQCHLYATLCRAIGFSLALAAWLTLCYSLLLPWDPETSSRRSPQPASASAGASVGAHQGLKGPKYPSDWMLIGTSFAIICGGLLITYSERRSHEELARQYERMEVVFDNGLGELARYLKDGSTPEDLRRARAVIEELGRESMMEHAQWLLLRRSRPLELQIGG